MAQTQPTTQERPAAEVPQPVRRAVRLLWVLFVVVVALALLLAPPSLSRGRPSLLLALLLGAFAVWLFQTHFISRGNEYGRWTFTWLAVDGTVAFVAALVKGLRLGPLNAGIALAAAGLAAVILRLLFSPVSNAWFKERRRALRLRMERLSATLAPLKVVRLPELSKLPDRVSIRQYRSADRDACVAIYRQNERNGIPQKYLAEFEDFLERSDHLRLVITQEEKVVGIGGIAYEPAAPQPRAWLAFGMISPPYQRRGLGKALLIARLGALQEPNQRVVVVMSNIGRSLRYYKRFGFSFIAKFPSSGGDEWFAHSAAVLDHGTWRRCRELADALQLDMSTLRVPAAERPQEEQSPTTTADGE